jgi:hypothetical protein
MMTAFDNPDEVDVTEPHVDVDVVMFRLDVDLAADADRHTRHGDQLWGRADLLVDPDGTVRSG